MLSQPVIERKRVRLGREATRQSISDAYGRLWFCSHARDGAAGCTLVSSPRTADAAARASPARSNVITIIAGFSRIAGKCGIEAGDRGVGYGK